MKARIRNASWLLAFAFGAAAFAQAQKPAAKKAVLMSDAQKKAQQEAVLDFEAELIEGERKRPDMFLQIGNEKQTMEAIIYGRKNFNDFHKDDSRFRPSFQETSNPKNVPARPRQ